MTFARFSTVAALMIGLTGAASAMPFTALHQQAAQLEPVQWGGHGWGHGGRGHHHGWRHHHRPRCWTERIVHRTPWGPRVDHRRVCR